MEQNSHLEPEEDDAKVRNISSFLEYRRSLDVISQGDSILLYAILESENELPESYKAPGFSTNMNSSTGVLAGPLELILDSVSYGTLLNIFENKYFLAELKVPIKADIAEHCYKDYNLSGAEKIFLTCLGKNSDFGYRPSGLIRVSECSVKKLSAKDFEDLLLKHGRMNQLRAYFAFVKFDNYFLSLAANSENIERKVLSIGNPASIISYCSTKPEIDAKISENFLLKIGDQASIASYFSKPKTKIKEFEDRILKIGRPREWVYFAYAVKGSDTRRISNELINYFKKFLGNKIYETNTLTRLLLDDMSSYAPLISKIRLKLLRKKILKDRHKQMAFERKHRGRGDKIISSDELNYF